MNRRHFLGASVAGLSLLKQTSGATAASGRRVLSLNRNWLFGGQTVAGASAPGFDDSKFQKVTLPHSNAVLPWHSFDEKQFQFVSIYRRRFRLPAELRGHRIFVDFEGAMTASAVTINGHSFPEYKG